MLFQPRQPPISQRTEHCMPSEKSRFVGDEIEMSRFRMQTWRWTEVPEVTTAGSHSHAGRQALEVHHRLIDVFLWYAGTFSLSVVLSFG